MRKCNCKFKEFLYGIYDRFSLLDWKDLSVFKLCIFSFGLLLGIYKSELLKKYSSLIWITFLGAYIYVIYKLVNVYNEDYEYEKWKMPKECDGCEDDCDDCLKF